MTTPVYTLADEIYARELRVPIEYSRRLRDFSFLSGYTLRTDEEEERVWRLQAELRDAGLDPGWDVHPREYFDPPTD